MDKEPLLKRLRGMAYGMCFRGNRFCCPFCGHHYSRFLSGGSHVSSELQALDLMGMGRRRNARCPHCGSNDRARLLYLYVRTTSLWSGRPCRVLDIAPDRHVARLVRAQPGIDYVCGSLFPEDYADLDAQAVDVTAIPFPDNDFDVVLCNHVLQEVPEDRRAMRELARVLKPEGWGIVQAPCARGLAHTVEAAPGMSPQERRAKLGSTLHVRLYGRDYAARLVEEGLIPAPAHPLRDGWCPDAGRYAVIDDAEICVVRKRT